MANDFRRFADRMRRHGKRVEDNANALVRKCALAVDATVVQKDVIVNENLYRIDGNYPITAWTAFDFAFQCVGTIDPAQIVGEWTLTRPVRLAANLQGSVAVCRTAPSSAAVLDFRVDGASAGSITFAIGTSTGSFTYIGQTTLPAGARIRIVGPSPADATMEGLAIRLLGWSAAQ